MSALKAVWPSWALAALGIALPVQGQPWPSWLLGLVGILIGTLARYAMRVQDRQPITWREIVVDLGLLGINLVLTMWTIERLGAEGKGAILLGALYAIGQGRVVRNAVKAFERRATKLLEAAGLGDPGPDTPAAPVQLALPSPDAPRGAQPGTPDNAAARVGSALLNLYGRKPTSAAADQIELLRKLDKDP